MSKYILQDMNFLFAVGVGDVQESMYVSFKVISVNESKLPKYAYLLNLGLCQILCWFDLYSVVPSCVYQHQRDSLLPFNKFVIF